MNWRWILMYPKQVMFFTCLIYPLISKSNKALECVSLFFFLRCKAWSWHNQINQRVPQANLWIIIYCILEMKADNKPAISLPVYFKSVKTENMCFDKKKKKKERKTKKKTSFRRWESNPGLSFFSRERLNYTTSAQHRSSCEYMNEELQ